MLLGCTPLPSTFRENANAGSATFQPSLPASSDSDLAAINSSGTTLATRILTPQGFERVALEEGSFGQYLRNFPLKPDGTRVLLFNGEEKGNQSVHAAVLVLTTGTRDLQQCADAVMRVRGEYLYQQKRYDPLHFNFTNGTRLDYRAWANGYRPVFSGNNVQMVLTAKEDYSYGNFLKYMEMVFNYAGTLSLEKELPKVDPQTDLKIGDVIIQGGSPGHAILVMDVAKKSTSGEVIILLAQSYMPAQDMHILLNPGNPGISPWYAWHPDQELVTPEWTFPAQALHRFP